MVHTPPIWGDKNNGIYTNVMGKAMKENAMGVILSGNRKLETKNS